MVWLLKAGSKLQNRGVRSCILSYTFTISITAHFSILNPAKWRLFKCTALAIKKRSIQCLPWPLINLSHTLQLSWLPSWMKHGTLIISMFLSYICSWHLLFLETREDIFIWWLFSKKDLQLLPLISNSCSALSPTIFCSNFAGCST